MKLNVNAIRTKHSNREEGGDYYYIGSWVILKNSRVKPSSIALDMADYSNHKIEIEAKRRVENGLISLIPSSRTVYFERSGNNVIFYTLRVRKST